ncbi:MAG TPA: GGDEF domain-containing protein [Acidobacteriaceae bacterium]
MESGATAVPEAPDPLLEAALECCGSTMRAVGRSAAEACPVTGRELDEAMSALAAKLPGEASPEKLREVAQQAERHLASWGAQTAEHLKVKTDEVRELMLMLAGTAESVGERDQRYSNQFSGLTADLKAVANLDDITQVRKSLLKKAAEMKTCVDAMAEDGRQSLDEMRAKVTDYEEKLRKAEELASKDPLTGLANRRGLEARMAWWAQQKRIFCVVMLDLNHFKELNDLHGHQAGDDLLRLFAAELSTRVRADDMVGRWGGDEFVVVIGRELEVAQRQLERIRQWVFGEYSVRTARGKEPLKVNVEAAVGLAEWVPGETLEELLKRADGQMYEEKRAGRRMTA